MSNKTDSIQETYVKLSPIEHVLKKPGMYIGDLDFRNEKQFIYSKNKIIQQEISWSPGLYKIVDELIVNAYDQSIRDKTLTVISAEINHDSFSIENDGVGIDVILHPTHNIYVPELIFANLLTSTNYSETEERITGGTHGLGAKLSAIFSKTFIIEVWDKKRKLYYSQTYENNLSKILKPKIIKYKENKGGVKITIHPDFIKFKTDKFSNEMMSLLERRIIDLIGLCRKNIVFNLNNKQIKYDTSFESYLKLYQSDEKWFIGGCVKNNLWEFAIRFNDSKSIDSGTHISFINGIYTNRGGKHVDYLIDLLLDKLQKIVSKDITKKLLNDYLTICLKASVINPTFNSQTKEELNTPSSKFGFKCDISDNFWNQIKNSDLVNQLKQVISLSNQKILSKLDGTKKLKIKNMPKLEDANFAGTKKSLDCVLILTEGDSAKATAISGISAISNGRNIFGVYPLRGKLLNVREASTSQINSNQEINDIKKIMGLKLGLTYTQENIKDLRYGAIMIMTDADEDGSHIKGLIINFFDYFYPSLLEIKGFIQILVTPLVKVSRGTQTLSFSNLRAYKIWKEKTKDNYLWKIKYYKGLGTSTSKEAGEYFKNLESNKINLIRDNKSNIDILLAFSKEKVNDRKLWLLEYNPDNILQLEPPTTITLKEFVHQELIHFSNYDNLRSIPSISDGFKPSQRKVLYGCLKKNIISEYKVAQLAAAIAEISAYHHGEQSLVSTIINMVQNFVGANNLNLLVPMGQFGTRLMGGKDHSSARYIYTLLESYVSKIFIKEDNDILEYLDDDGYQIEPKYYLPIIPIVLVNGCEGIGTGFSTSIPNYNPLDIIIWLENKINNKKNISLIPYYKNFKGNIIKYDDFTWITEGLVEINKNEIIITELPIKMWTNDYKEFLEDLIYEKKSNLFKSYSNLSSDIEIKFILKIDDIEQVNNLLLNKDEYGMNDLYKYLHLYKTIKQSNMNLYTTDYKIKTFKNADEIISEFYSWRLKFYDQRKELILNKLNESIKYISNQIKFINLVIQENGKILKLDELELEKYLMKNKIIKVKDSYDYLTNMTFKQITKQNLEKLEKKLKENKLEYKQTEEKTNKIMWLHDLNELKLILQ
jgi:DNA topoisomerase-2